MGGEPSSCGRWIRSSYDLDSDRLTRVDGSTSTTFTYDWTGELYQQTISGSKTFAYDRYGNLTTAWDSSSNSITYAYDEASRPTGITPQTGSAATLTPDALDRTKTRTVGASTDTRTGGFLAELEIFREDSRRPLASPPPHVIAVRPL